MDNSSQFSPDRIAAMLLDLPTGLYQSDCRLIDLEAIVREQAEAVEIAEINASLNAPEGKNAAERDLQRKATLAKDETVRATKRELNAAQSNLEHEKANNKMLSRQFAGLCHLSELKAAQMQLMSKGATR